MAGEILLLKAAVEEEFPTVRSLGTYNRRKIAGTNVWSQHAYDPPYGWAWDIRPPASDQHQVVDAGKSNTLDQVFRRLSQWRAEGRRFGGYKIGTILWRVRAHYDHIHVELSPKRRGTPPIYNPEDDVDMEKLKEIVTDIQKSLMASGYDLPRFGADGVWGDETAAAFDAMVSDAANGGSGNHKHKFSGMTGGPV